jgi:hypothetical protein
MPQLVAKLKDLAPYAVIVLLPGGSLLALMFWLLRRAKAVPVLADLLN